MEETEQNLRSGYGRSSGLDRIHEDEELYCQDNGMYYEPNKPNYPLVIVLLLIAGIFWPLVILFAVFVPLTFLLMDKMGQLHPKDDDEMDPEEDTYL